MKAVFFIIILNTLFIFINLKQVLYLERNQTNTLKNFLNTQKANKYFLKLSNENLIYKRLLFRKNNFIKGAEENNTNNNNSDKGKDDKDKKDDDDDDHTKLLIIICSAFGAVIIIAIIIIVYFKKSKSSYDNLKERVYKISFSEEDDDGKRKESDYSE